jgi:hypothetical protein
MSGFSTKKPTLHALQYALAAFISFLGVYFPFPPSCMPSGAAATRAATSAAIPTLE